MTVQIEDKIVGVSVVKEKENEPKKVKRPTVLKGETHKLRNHSLGYNIYVTVNYHEDTPYEVFFTSSHAEASEWVLALSRLSSSMLQTGSTLEDISNQLVKVHSPQGYHAGGKGGYVAGVVQHIGKTLKHIHKTLCKAPQETSEPLPNLPHREESPSVYKASKCPECTEQMTLRDGCWTCDCGYSKCS